MKHFYIPTVILAILLGASLWTWQYVEGRTDHWSGLLVQADQSGGSERWDAAREELEQVYQDWQGSQTFFHVILPHEELDRAEELFAGALAVCREEDGADFHQLMAQLVKQMELLAETQRASVQNIL